jgi:hypothetical protein
MSTAPELGTSPRPDVTGIGIYTNAGAHLGINPTAGDKDTNITVNWDYPEARFPPGATYTVEASFHANFQDDEATAAKLQTGLAGAVTAATFTLDFDEFVAYGTATPTVKLNALGNKAGQQIYVRIKAVDTGTWSETLSCPLGPTLT